MHKNSIENKFFIIFYLYCYPNKNLNSNRSTNQST